MTLFPIIILTALGDKGHVVMRAEARMGRNNDSQQFVPIRKPPSKLTNYFDSSSIFMINT
jgi:hypothetical protein